jgi:PKHD-type hydroxylase
MITDHALRTNIYTQEECVEICQLFQSNINVTIRDLPSKDAVKSSKVGNVEFGKVKEKVEKFKNLSLDANKHLFGFDLFQYTDLEVLLYNVYDIGGEYGWHTDAVRGEVKDIKLTALLNVSTEPFEGGELELFFNSKPEPITQFREPGSFFIFPSWIPHRVTPVTSGRRKTITLFLQGPNFK